MDNTRNSKQPIEDRGLSIRPDVQLYFDAKSGTYCLANHDTLHDVVLMPISALTHIQAELIQKFGTVGAVLLQNIGEVAGAQSAKGVLNNPEKETELRQIFSSTSKWGFGRYELLELDPDKYIRIRLKNNNLKMTTGQSSALYKHHYLIGFYRKYFSTVLGRNYSCEERICVNLDYKYCEFELSPA